jgi:urease beta subunit
LISANGNIIGANLVTPGSGGSISGTGNIIGGNILTAGLISAAGTITVNSGAAATAIINGAGNAVGNIGSSSTYFNQVFAQATTALYADLAEVYAADADYPPGTVLSFGGTKEVTISTVDSNRRVAGVISENPSYLMNAGLETKHRAVVALTGRVPTRVVGPVAKGDMMVSAGNGCARAEENPILGSVIGKALEDFDGTEGVIEIVVGRL